MLYKGIIIEILSNGYQAKVRIPILEKIYNSSYSVNNYNLATAPIITQPGLKPAYVPGDIVYIDFEEDNYDYPVIIGCLYKENIKSSTNIATQSLNVEVNASLPKETTFKED